MSNVVCLTVHKAHIRVRFLSASLRFLWCDKCGAIR